MTPNPVALVIDEATHRRVIREELAALLVDRENKGLPLDEAAQLLGCGRRQLDAFIAKGIIKAYDIAEGGERARLRITKAEIERFREARRVK